MSEYVKMRVKAPKPKPDSLRWGRPPLTKMGRVRRYRFTNIWCRDVLLGHVKDHDKLIAHGIHLRLGTRSQLNMVEFGILLRMVQDTLRKVLLKDITQREYIKSLLE